MNLNYCYLIKQLRTCFNLMYFSIKMPEEQAFGVLMKIMFDYHTRDMFRNGFEELHLKFFQLQKLMEVFSDL